MSFWTRKENGPSEEELHQYCKPVMTGFCSNKKHGPNGWFCWVVSDPVLLKDEGQRTTMEADFKNIVIGAHTTQFGKPQCGQPLRTRMIFDEYIGPRDSRFDSGQPTVTIQTSPPGPQMSTYSITDGRQ